MITHESQPGNSSSAATSAAGISSLLAATHYPHNLPLQLTSFIGREDEINAIKQRLWTTRLLTLAGPGGCGKSRLALRVAHDLLDAFADGVWWIEVAPLTDPNLIAQTVVAALGLRVEANRALLDGLIAYLRAQQILLIFDNCEHLIGACARLIHALLQACPDLYALVTSREVLNSSGEVVFLVPPMLTPFPDQLADVKALSQFEAVRLFVERAANSWPDFKVTDHNTAAIAQVCYRLDGMPLAIELAAARVKMLQVEQIVARLDDRFELLTGGKRTALLRHQTLRAAIDWSYDLLNEDERRMLRRLSVFAGGWTLEAAEAVCSERMDDESAGVLDRLTQLANKSLVVVERQQGQATRYRLLETIWQYAAEKLAASDDKTPARDRHLAYFTALAEQTWHELLSPNYQVWTRHIAIEIDNIRTALNWSLADGELALGLRLAIGLFQFWIQAGYVAESIDIYRNLLASPKAAVPNPLRAKALAFLSLSHLRLGDHEQALIAAQTVLACEMSQRGEEASAYALTGQGHAYALQAKYSEALDCLEQSLALFQTLDHVVGQAWALSRLGTVALHMGDFERAETWLADLADLMRAAKNTMYLTYALRYLGLALLQRGDVAQALAKFKEELAVWQRLEEISASELGAFAATAVAMKQWKRAAYLLGAVQARIEVQRNVLLPYEHDLCQHNMVIVGTELGEAAFESAWNEGRALSAEQMLELALTTNEAASPAKVPQMAVAKQALGGLTKREREVAALVAQGKSNREIAQTLVLSEYTVASHVSNILSKLEFASRTQIVAWAIDKGLAKP